MTKQSDLFHSRARLADLKLAKRLMEAAYEINDDVNRKRCKRCDAFAVIMEEAAGRLMLRADPEKRAA